MTNHMTDEPETNYKFLALMIAIELFLIILIFSIERVIKYRKQAQVNQIPGDDDSEAQFYA